MDVKLRLNNKLDAFEVNKPFFYIVDVFAEKKYSGNQLAVFRSVKELYEKEMQQIAKEMHAFFRDNIHYN